MARQRQDMLLPGEILTPGDCLISADNRFRLYLEENVGLVAYAYYSDNRGVQRFKTIPAFVRAGMQLEFKDIPPPHPHPDLVIRYPQTDRIYWELISVSGQIMEGWENLSFVIQNDGNIVWYAHAGDSTRVGYASNTNTVGSDQIAVAPNVDIVTVPDPGRIVAQPGALDVGIKNSTAAPIIVRDSSQTITVPPQQEVSAQIPGSISVSLAHYSFSDLHEGNGTTHSADDSSTTELRVTNSGVRQMVEVVTGGGLVAHGFLDRPGFDSLSRYKMSTKSRSFD